MIHEAVGEIWLIVEDERDVVCAGDVFRGDDDELVPGNVAVEGDVRDLAARDGTPHGRAVKHVREGQIIDVQRLTGDFSAALFAGNWFADGMISHLEIRV